MKKMEDKKDNQDGRGHDHHVNGDLVKDPLVGLLQGRKFGNQVIIIDIVKSP
jgi:hypothetical protein